jgi:predicted O-methyltransferase YrrM
MRTMQRVKRREFLQASSVAGVVGWLGGCGVLAGRGGDAVSASSGPPPPAALDAQLAAIAREFPTAAREEGQFLSLLIKLARARRVLELGTGYGYTTIWLALALEETGGKLTTVEIAPERVELARRHVARAGLTHRVSFKRGDAHALVPQLGGRFDVAYLDADKNGQVDYFHKLFPKKLLPGSLLIAHNAILRADAMQDYLELVHRHPAFDTVLVRMTADDGLALSRRRRPRS